MSSIKPERLSLKAEIKADIATMSDIANVSLATLRQYQTMLITLRREKPCPRWGRSRLLFVCREARHAYQEASETIAIARKTLDAMPRDREGRA